jgi:hypothetical protein
MIYIPYSKIHSASTPPKVLPSKAEATSTPAVSDMQDFIAKSISLHDLNHDGEISLEEAATGPGLTGNTKSLYSTEDGKALWASISGPNGTMGAWDYGQYLLYLDKDGNGTITSEEAQQQKHTLISDVHQKGSQGVIENYTRLIAMATQKGLDVETPLGDEQRYALSYAHATASAQSTSNTPPPTETAHSQGQVQSTAIPPPTSGSGSASNGYKQYNPQNFTMDQFMGLMINISRLGDLSTLPAGGYRQEKPYDNGAGNPAAPSPAPSSPGGSQNTLTQLLLVFMLSLLQES